MPKMTAETAERQDANLICLTPKPLTTQRELKNKKADLKNMRAYQDSPSLSDLIPIPKDQGILSTMQPLLKTRGKGPCCLMLACICRMLEELSR